MSDLHQLMQQHPRGLTLQEIALHLDVTTRSARRYLKEMRFELEAFEERPGGAKRWRIPAVDLPRRVSVRRTQAYALLAARSVFEPLRGSTLFEEIDLAAQELLAVARRPGRGPNGGTASDRLEQRFRSFAFAPKDHRHCGEVLDILFQGVADLQPLRIRLRMGANGTYLASVHPYALLLYKDDVVLLAAGADEPAIQSYDLQSIVDAWQDGDGPFELPEDFRVDDYVQGNFGVWRNEEPLTEVVIDFQASVASAIASRTFHPSQQLETLADGTLRMRLQLANLSELCGWLLGFGETAFVQQPQQLRQAVRTALERALARYQKP